MRVKGPIPSLSMLRAFEAIARTGGFSRAAGELNITQAAISYQIRALEERLGTELFARTGRAVTLTPAGRAYLRDIQTALQDIAQATARVMAGSRRSPSRQIRVLAMQAFASLWLVPRLARFQRRNPGFKVNLVSWIGGTERISKAEFDQHELDLSIIYTRPSAVWPGVTKDLLIPDWATPVCAPDLPTARRPLRVPEDLRHHTMIHALNWPGMWARWLRHADAGSVRPRSEVSMQHTAFTVQAAMSGMGIAIAHAPLVQDYLKAKRLVAPFRAAMPVDAGYYLTYPAESSQDEGVQRFAEWLRSEFRAARRQIEKRFDCAG